MINLKYCIAFVLSLITLTGCGLGGGSDGLSEQQISDLLDSEAYVQMRSNVQFGVSAVDLDAQVQRARDAKSNFIPSEIDPKKHYEVIIQVGHIPRTSGATGSQGALINEQEGAALIAELLSEELSTLDIDFAVIGADSYRDGEKRDSQHYFKTDIFISLHLDGSDTNPCGVGPSIGYNKRFGAEAMQLLALAIAVSLELNAGDFMRDNYTSNLEHFYAYKHSDTQIAEGILEMSELSCPSSEKKFLTKANVMADNIATAITFMLK